MGKKLSFGVEDIELDDSIPELFISRGVFLFYFVSSGTCCESSGLGVHCKKL